MNEGRCDVTPGMCIKVTQIVTGAGLPRRFERLQLWLGLTGLTVLTRLPALLYPRAIDDEAVYAVVARVMLAGGLPYRDAIERKPPLLFAVYWAVFRLFGQANWLALHLVAVAWILLTMAGLSTLVERFYSLNPLPVGVARVTSRWGRAGALTALFYALVQPWATAKNLAFNGEVMMNLPLAWAYALILNPRRSSLVTPLAAGMLLAAAFLLKQPAAIAAIPPGLYLLTAPLWRPNSRWPQAVAEAAALTTGFVAVLGAAMALLWQYGLLGEAYYWTMADHTVPHIFWQHGLEHTALFMAVTLPLVLPLTRWQLFKQAWRGIEPELRTILGWLAVSVIGACAGARFYPHYYIQLVPSLAVLAGIFYARTSTPNPGRPSLRFAAIWLAIAALITLVIQTSQLLADRAASPAARYVAARAHPADRLFVWGQQTPMYLDANLLPASRYIATYPLTGYIFGGALPGVSTRDRIVPGAWSNLATDFAHHPPQFIIDTQSSPGDEYPIHDFPQLANFVANNYRHVAAFPDGTIYRRSIALSP